MRVVYVDNNATTRVAPEVSEAMEPFFGELYGNPSSMHTFGGQIARYVSEARERVAALLGADASEVTFTSGGTECDNTAIMGVLDANPDKRHIITTRVEHPAVRNVCQHLVTHGYHVTELGVDGEGMVNLDELSDAITDDTALISMMWANNETGVIFPIEDAAKIAREQGVIFHTDAVQAVGKIPIDMKKVPVDLLSLSGHKLHGPKGIGALYVRPGTRMTAYIMGGHQEHGRRAGTENTAGIVGLGKAAELAAANMDAENTRVRAMRDRLEEELLKRAAGALRNGHPIHRLPNTSNVAFEYIEGEAILLLLDEQGICASSGSACTSGSLEPSHVLRAMGVPYTCVHGSVRFSLSIYNTDDDIDCIVEKLPPIIERLRAISPFVKT